MKYSAAVIRMQEHPEWIVFGAEWFSSKWGIPSQEYKLSMEQSLQTDQAFPQWYLCLCNGKIIAGAGVIENDFHDRKDLSPNICALYVEPEYRGQGIAGHLLEFICTHQHQKGIDTLYLLTDHIGFYEHYGWKFLCMVRAEGDDYDSRMYQRQYGENLNDHF